jgi:hypothetical protein
LAKITFFWTSFDDLVIPNKEQLIAEVEKVLEKWHNSEKFHLDRGGEGMIQ